MTSLGGNPGSREPDPSSTGSGPSGFDPGRWRGLVEAPDYISRCLCVEDAPGHCAWHFGEHIEGQWFDLSSGAEINPTHWMPLPPTPTGGEIADYAMSNGIGNAPETINGN